ncbi:MAG: GxxExxY protein [Gemmatimonadetes bacterium]|nr:GxxExxY protein [Gemmatimonadota bacterium]
MAVELSAEEISWCVINAALRVHRAAGPGLLESAYQVMLTTALRNDGLCFELQVPVAVHFEGAVVPNAYRVDLVVEGLVLVELKSVEHLAPVHARQVLTYLRLTGIQLGLLINFNVPRLKEGIRRVVNGHVPSGSSRLRIAGRESRLDNSITRSREDAK